MKAGLIHICFSLLLLFFPGIGLFADETEENREVFVVVIDPGHGGTDPGACGKNSYEKDINLAVAKRLGNQIKANHKDVKVIYTRETDVKIALDRRSQIANAAKADLFISIHTNAMDDKQMKGVETYVYGDRVSKAAMAVALRENAGAKVNGTSNPNGKKYFKQNLHFANEVQNAFEKGNRINIGVKQAHFLVLKNTSMPAVLVEIGYITNDGEEKYMNSVAGQKAISKAIYTAFTKYKKEIGKVSDVRSSTTVQTGKAATKKEDKKPAVAEKGKITYRVQFLLSGKKLPKNSPEFKGLSPVGFYVEKNLYKYTYGDSSDVKEIIKKRDEIRKKFGDAFIVIFKDGKRIGIYTGN